MSKEKQLCAHCKEMVHHPPKFCNKNPARKAVTEAAEALKKARAGL